MKQLLSTLILIAGFCATNTTANVLLRAGTKYNEIPSDNSLVTKKHLEYVELMDWMYIDVFHHGSRDVAPPNNYELLEESIRWSLHKKDDRCVLVFRGTKFNDLEDVIVDATSAGVCSEEIHGVRLNPVFYKHYETMKDGIVSTLNEMITNNKCSGAIDITGHSLGGAMAMMALNHLVDDEMFDVEDVITIGSPRLFSTYNGVCFCCKDNSNWPFYHVHGRETCDIVEDRVDGEIVRFVHYENNHKHFDPIPAIPFQFDHCATSHVLLLSDESKGNENTNVALVEQDTPKKALLSQDQFLIWLVSYDETITTNWHSLIGYKNVMKNILQSPNEY